MKKLVCVPLNSQPDPRGGSRPQAGQDVYLAVDLSRSKWVYQLRWNQQDQRCLSTPGALSHLQALVAQYRECRLHVVYEACGFGDEIAWWLMEQSIDVLVIAPSKVERAPGLSVKTDRTDVRVMARKREQEQLKGIYVPRRQEHERRELSRTYTQALKESKRARTRIRSLLQEQGRIGPAPNFGWAPYAQWLSEQSLPRAVAICVEELLSMRLIAVNAAKRLKAELLNVAAEPTYAPIVKALAEQTGVGQFTAIRFVLEVGEITRFVTADSITNYLGLIPSQYSSGELDHRGHIVKSGPGFVRAWIIQCAWASIRGQHPDTELKQCFERLAPRIGKKRAIVAVARRLVRRLRARWLEVLSGSEVIRAA
jgi:transposase